jgi:hypothetical protein
MDVMQDSIGTHNMNYMKGKRRGIIVVAKRAISIRSVQKKKRKTQGRRGIKHAVVLPILLPIV